MPPLDTKPYRPPGQISGPDVGCVWAFAITIAVAAIIAIGYWVTR